MSAVVLFWEEEWEEEEVGVERRRKRRRRRRTNGTNEAFNLCLSLACVCDLVLSLLLRLSIAHVNSVTLEQKRGRIEACTVVFSLGGKANDGSRFFFDALNARRHLCSCLLFASDAPLSTRASPAIVGVDALVSFFCFSAE